MQEESGADSRVSPQEENMNTDLEDKNNINTAWTEYQDDEGRTYYYNDITQESVWEIPPGVTAKLAEEVDGERDDGAGHESLGGDVSLHWTRYQDDDGRDYYYNSVTQLTQWEMPEGFEEEKEENNNNLISLDQRNRAKQSNESDDVTTEQNVSVQSKDLNKGNDVSKQDSDTVSEQDLIDRDPISTAQKALEQTDSVLEIDAVNHVFTLLEHKDPNDIMKTMVSSYHGTTAICGVLSRWLLELKNANSSIPSTTSISSLQDSPSVQSANAESIRDIITQDIERTAKTNFTYSTEKNILNLTRKDRSFLDEMMEHVQWRKLLIELSSEHKESALLTYCLQTMSKKGFHREIAKRINQSDYFNVFHGMLKSELSFIGTLSVNHGQIATSHGDQSDDNDVERLVRDLTRQCTSTEYTYIYVMKILDDLILRSKERLADRNLSEAEGISRAIHKWQRVRDEIQRDMINPSGTEMVALTRKRRADIAMSSSELYQKQRKIVSNHIQGVNSAAGMRYSIDEGIFTMLKKYSMGTNLDEEILNQLLYNPNKDPSLSDFENNLRIGKSIYSQSLVIEYLLKSLFVTGTRVKTTEMRMKCSKLIAMAAIAVQNDAKSVFPSHTVGNQSYNDNDIDCLSKEIFLGSELCQQLENVVKFVVTDDVSDVSNSSVGSKLSGLCIKNSIVSQGCLLWAIDKSQNEDFPTSAAYPYTGPGLLSLTRIVSKHHPLLRELGMQVALQFLSHSNPELSYQKLSGIKEQALRLLLIISTKGMAVEIFNALTTKLKSGVLDAGLVRYFVGGCIEIMSGPYSPPIVRAFGKFLIDKSCVDILNAVYFDSKKKRALRKMMHEFNGMMADDFGNYSRITVDDRNLVLALKEAYTFPSII